MNLLLILKPNLPESYSNWNIPVVQELPRTILQPYRYNYYLSSSTTTNIGHYDHDDDNLPDRHAYANPFTIFSKRRRAGSCESLLPIGARWCACTTLLFTVTAYAPSCATCHPVIDKQFLYMLRNMHITTLSLTMTVHECFLCKWLPFYLQSL